MSSAAERKRLSRKRAAEGEQAPGRVRDGRYETRDTPRKSGNQYEHELTPDGPPLPPRERKNLQSRRSGRIAAVRKRSAGGKAASAAAASNVLMPDYPRPEVEKKNEWKLNEEIFVGGKLGKVVETIGGRYLKKRSH